ncbi:MAG: hypothetical protein ICV77_05435 [Cyanobacteria bacterium Co-bin8]|nr:hypothetical protein [Cyanobacteria bacterium Co-bin8]
MAVRDCAGWTAVRSQPAEDLGLGIEPEDEFYRFAIAAATEDYTAQIAIARQPEMTSYLGLVYLVSTQEGPITVAVVCETANPWTQLPEIGPSPATLEEEPTCPEGFEVLSSSIERFSSRLMIP